MSCYFAEFLNKLINKYKAAGANINNMLTNKQTTFLISNGFNQTKTNNDNNRKSNGQSRQQQAAK